MEQIVESRLRNLDHIVLAVRDLEAAASFFERLGFQIGARNRHPWGTENRLIQFDGSFIELITIGSDPSKIPPHGAGQFSFGAFVRDYLGQREGIAMLVLTSDDAIADAGRFDRAGIGSFDPFYFERMGRRPDGSAALVAFTLAFATNANAPLAAFFVCQHHFPRNFWNPAFQRHSNGGRSILSVEMAVPDPSIHAAFLSDFTGRPAAREARELHFQLGNGCLRVAADAVRGAIPRHHAVSIEMPDIASFVARLNAEGIAYDAIEDGVCLPAERNFGTELRFRRKAADR
ncbi:hypothetical protein ASE00_16710 [Sphingomonas sp. Root710]|nr:hypothetical protein ASE00_16710 [Sphingomonas sp. Root710]